MTVLLWVIVITLPLLLIVFLRDTPPRVSHSLESDHEHNSTLSTFYLPTTGRLPRNKGSSRSRRFFAKKKRRNRVRNRIARKSRKINQNKNGRK